MEGGKFEFNNEAQKALFNSLGERDEISLYSENSNGEWRVKKLHPETLEVTVVEIGLSGNDAKEMTVPISAIREKVPKFES